MTLAAVSPYAQADRCPPTVEAYVGVGGARRDVLRTSEAWRALKRAAAEAQVASPRSLGRSPRSQQSRAVQFARVLLFSASSGMVGCPVAMTDGAATALETFAARDGVAQELRASCLRVAERLRSADADAAFTSGQWMTEPAGGSDVRGATRTRASPLALGEAAANQGQAAADSGFEPWLPAATHRLDGVKWFSSAADAEVALALAADPEAAPGRLSLFLVRVTPQVGGGVRTRRLKAKLGTRQLPTAELTLSGVLATRLGAPGEGLRGIGPMLAVSRLHNVAAAASHARLAWRLADDYCGRRRAGGRLVRDYPLVARTLRWLAAASRGMAELTLECASLLSAAEDGDAVADSQLRVLTPAAKAWTARLAVACCTEAMELLGGNGYVADAGVEMLVRDCHVLPLWEGTTFIMSLDVLRAIRSAGGKAALEALLSDAAAAAEAAAEVRTLESLLFQSR